MRDFPIFATENGVSSLLLREVPYRGTAYIRIQSVSAADFSAHLKECADFCRAVGAERIFAEGHSALEQYPLHSEIVVMRGQAWTDPQKAAQLFPVTQTTAEKWRQLYNERMARVDHAKTLEQRDEKELTEGVGAYFVHREGQLLGIGWLDGYKLLAMAAAAPGAGETVMHTMMSLMEGEDMLLEVASTNQKAIALYERLGFCKTEIARRWYQIL